MPSPDNYSSSPHIPHTPGAIVRPRPLHKLCGALEHRLTVISAPPGYGKTTLVAQYVQDISTPVTWHTIEGRERDVSLLYMHALAALESVTPGIGKLSTAKHQPPHELAAIISEHLRKVLKDDIIYVIDDLQELEGAPDAEMWLRTLVALVPPTCHLVLISRKIPDLPFVEMLAHSDVLAIGQEELKFTEQETAILARSLYPTSPPEVDSARLTERLDGWPAGVRLALQPLPPTISATILGQGDAPEALFGQLARQMLQTQLPGLRDFMFAASTLQRLNPEYCSEILEVAESESWLNAAWSNRLFIYAVGNDLILHPLFRDFLQDELRQQDPARFARLHDRAAQWFEARDEVEEAFTHYFTSGNVRHAAEIAERVAPFYSGQGKQEALLRWHKQLETAQVVPPWLSYACAIIYGDRYEYDAAEAELEKAASTIGVAADIQRAFLNQQRGRHQQVLSHADDLLDLPPEAEHLRARALRIVGVSYMMSGNAARGTELLEASVELYRQSKDISNLSHALQDLQVAYTRLGRLDLVGTCLQEVVALRRSLGGSGALALALNNLGYYYHQRGDYEQALNIYQEGLSTIAQIRDRRAESYLRWSLADLMRDLGRFDEALGLYSRALDLISAVSEPRLNCAILVSAAVLYRWQGRVHQAVSTSEEALALAQKYDLGFERSLARANLWTARATLNLATEALSQLDEVVAELEQQDAQYEMLGVLMMRAGVYLLYGDTPNAELNLRRALDTACEVGSAQPVAVEIFYTPSLAEWMESHPALLDAQLREALRRLQEAKVIVRLPDYREEPVPTVTQPLYSLRVLTLGQEMVMRNGKAVPISQWRGALNRELFLYLLFHGPQTREAIALAFWPEAGEKQTRDNFHSALYQIRQAVGKEAILFENNLYCVNPSITLWCDAHELERLAHRARLLPSRDARTEDLWRKATTLYLGDFLPSVDSRWTYYYREKMRDYFIEALAGLAECARARHNWYDAVAYLKQALDVDPFREDVHRAVMTCYASDMGQKKPALDQFEALKRLLQQELGLPPSEETLELASRLL